MSKFFSGSTIVVDASVAISAVLPADGEIDAMEYFGRWRQGDVRLIAPSLWLAECVSAIRKIMQSRTLSLERARRAVDDVFALEVEVIPISRDHCRAALAWGERLGQSRAYDSFYLAVAEESGAELWTADRRLVNAARQAGVTWVQEIQ